MHEHLHQKVSILCLFMVLHSLLVSKTAFQRSIYNEIGVHYENVPMLYKFFLNCKNWTFSIEKFIIFNILAQNIDCGYTLEPPQQNVRTALLRRF